MYEKKILAAFDNIRILAVAVSFFFGYRIGFQNGGYNPEAQLHFMIPIIVIVISGLTGIEGLFFAKFASEIKGFETGSNYQRQSAISQLSYAFVTLLVYILNWGIKAELTIFFAFIFFMICSAVNHLIDAVTRKNYKWQNINRPIFASLLVAGMLYPLIEMFKRL
ncbi:MAG: hypothetical protein A2008_05755 [Candidatus Wallbacteria bacterium GWC2_49_35]|uniref:Uncharacterized protein n=1 Tax=Candidatus Wallbacteria bacterium GWC2_49_35 TaxID=1817813 RepID=A0A1F7WJU1_9BACT|nr:MAG: hypothetical protein A2008_05755 [Candidatus Wallbacteria bacterium GWC2_49_35]HBC75540.1 hypothetical protein [Candidatus Wallbacteria bacterium]